MDGQGDPRIGMHGASYGGGIEWAASTRDHRIDAIAPAISWNSLTDALARDARVKIGWGAGLVGLGETSGLAVGALAPQGPETGAFPTALVNFTTQGLATGIASPQFLEYLRSHSTNDLIRNVRAPALILQGTADTLFGLDQAARMRELLRPAGVPVKTMFFCGGHGVCLTGNGLEKRQEPAILAWMDRWVKGDASVDTGPGFEWTSDDGEARSAADYPLAPGGSITATGSGTLALGPGTDTSGTLVAATPSATGISIPIPAPAKEADVVGDPQLRMTYRGTAVNPPAHVFAQIVDDTRGVVVGNQAIPISVTLDGAEHTLESRLEGVAMRVTPSSRYRLQLISDTTDYGVGRAVGTVKVENAQLTLPVGDAAATKPATVAAPGLGTAAKACRSHRTITVSLPRRPKLHRVVVLVNGRRIKHTRVRHNRVRFSLSGRGKGSYTVKLFARRRDGRRVSTTRRYRTCVSGATYKSLHKR